MRPVSYPSCPTEFVFSWTSLPSAGSKLFSCSFPICVSTAVCKKSNDYSSSGFFQTCQYRETEHSGFASRALACPSRRVISKSAAYHPSYILSHYPPKRRLGLNSRLFAPISTTPPPCPSRGLSQVDGYGRTTVQKKRHRLFGVTFLVRFNSFIQQTCFPTAPPISLDLNATTQSRPSSMKIQMRLRPPSRPLRPALMSLQANNHRHPNQTT